MKSLKIISFLPFLLLFACGATQPTEGNEEAQNTHDYPTTGSIESYEEALDAIISTEAKIEILARGFNWSEGPLWLPEQEMLIFSDVPENTVYSWQEGDTTASVYLRPSGFTGEKTDSGEPGSNGLTLSPEGRLVLCQHGDRRVAVTDLPITGQTATFETLADKFDGKRFHSPNDVVYHPVSGEAYFTDPPYGLPGQANSELKELKFYGVFRLDNEGQVHSLDRTLIRPNGIAFSPDGKKAYVAQSFPLAAQWFVYDVAENGKFTERKSLLDVTKLVEDNPGLPDGLKVAKNGTLFATGPGGVHVLSPDGKRLGLIRTGRATANCAFGPDEKTLYMTADDLLLRVALK
ncbi:gluconolactonase [Lewinellaceae bacterium SD302]|nr:gluconolactonase [Lewinellaceae bacterium SD302]